MKTSHTSVVAGIIEQNGLFLITQRFEDSHLGGLWEFPGGKLNEGESDETALIRELKEEIGIECSVGELVHEVTWDYTDISIHLKFYTCAVISGAPTPIECAAVKWVKRSELSQYEFPPSDKNLIEMISNF